MADCSIDLGLKDGISLPVALPVDAANDAGVREFFELALHDLQSAVSLLDTSIRHLDLSAPTAGADATSSIRDAQIAVRRLQQYIDHVVTADRVSRGTRVPAFRRPVALASLIEELAAEYEHQLWAWDIDLSLEMPPVDSLEVRGDEVLLRRVLQNLLENSLRHNERGGRVSIAARRTRRDGVCIEFCNDGTAIHPEMRERIFEKYVSVGGRGTAGVGLYFCRAAAEVHNGTIAVVDHPSWAVCLRLTLPRGCANDGGGRPPAPRGAP